MRGFIINKQWCSIPSNVIFKGKTVIKVSINGEIKELEKGLNIRQMIELLEYKQKGFAVAINTTFVSIQNYESTVIKNGDTIDILAPVQGG